MARVQGRSFANKWAKQAALLSHPRIAGHIPPTRMYSQRNLRSMLITHGMVVIKPVKGTGGNGVIKVSRQRDGYYSYTHSSVSKRFVSMRDLILSLARVLRGRSYLIQKGIQLAVISGRPIDYRVKYVKVGRRWQIRAMVGRLARKGLFVTNLCRGGTQLTAAQGIKRSLSASLVQSKKREMRALTLISTQVMERRFPGIRQLGYDYGIDRRGKIWIFEVNTRPH